MKEYIECKPVMLPMPPQAIGNCLVKDNTGRIFMSAGESERSYATRVPQHLYLVSEEEIKSADWILIKDPDYYGGHKKGWTVTHAGSDLAATDWRKKIVVSSDKSLSLPLIPSSFIEEWVEKQGKIEKVRVKLNPSGHVAMNAYANDGTRSFDPGVIILPIEDKMYSREEVKKIAMAWAGFCFNADPKHVAPTRILNEWFDQYYPI